MNRVRIHPNSPAPDRSQPAKQLLTSSAPANISDSLLTSSASRADPSRIWAEPVQPSQAEPTVKHQRFRPYFHPDLSPVRDVEILGYFLNLCTEFSSWIFYFMVDTYILMVMKRKLNEICMRLSHIFGVLMIIMGMKNEKIILKNYSDIFPRYLNRSAAMLKWGWLEKLGGKNSHSSVDVDLSCKTYFLLSIYTSSLSFERL